MRAYNDDLEEQLVRSQLLQVPVEMIDHLSKYD